MKHHDYVIGIERDGEIVWFCRLDTEIVFHRDKSKAQGFKGIYDAFRFCRKHIGDCDGLHPSKGFIRSRKYSELTPIDKMLAAIDSLLAEDRDGC